MSDENWYENQRESVIIVEVISGGVSAAFVAILAGQRRPSIESLAFIIILLPLSFFYTTVRYRIFDIYIRIRLSLVYAIIQVFLFLAFILSLFFLIKFLPRWDIELPDFFFTALYGIFNSLDRTVNIYRMGHNGLIYYDSSRKKIEVIEPGGIAFGIAGTDQFKNELFSHKINYTIGDLFVFLTDGFMEAMNKEMQPFGEKDLCDIVFNNVNENATTIMDKLQDAIFSHSSGQQLDDATGIVVKIIS
jgi:hypothetical protein